MVDVLQEFYYFVRFKKYYSVGTEEVKQQQLINLSNNTDNSLNLETSTLYVFFQSVFNIHVTQNKLKLL